MEDLQEEQIRPITQHFPSFLLDKKPPPHRQLVRNRGRECKKVLASLLSSQN